MSILHTIHNRKRITDRQADELIGLARGFLVDGHLCDSEIMYLYKWLAAQEGYSDNPVVRPLFSQVKNILEDGIISDEEREDLATTLSRFTGSEIEVGEVLTSTSLPIDANPPEIVFPEKRFCFTGTFLFGTRRECEEAVTSKNGDAGGLNKKTDFLVIGAYATDSWIHSSYGRKIERGCELREEHGRLSIVTEDAWSKALESSPQINS